MAHESVFSTLFGLVPTLLISWWQKGNEPFLLIIAGIGAIWLFWWTRKSFTWLAGLLALSALFWAFQMM
ncbi:hypothetical protein EDM54_05520 [Brevibacillus borstelensis]|uniref:hypothetical protein n=1 Tax=Brevibacillus borstelensis TaxID=45462 RepID=UPI0004F3BEFA|nr:hypothetical protein [Brevibacillus borstelensis]KKX56389.1 hypothetical protein X546_02955 [Brevibacillus borstelensis cifa_chp40]MED1742619.1 hypothetical protein [Brevibacillus borstelensis]MED1872956.1 hypothetical protein [Brevibacillus borstelensis]MED1882210.1 hypothetical protein [Brevibacillus borstelensis]RNB64710.1 hypothetical protein EDM54_05520 [Brevibacillus borstelensis]